MNGIDISNWQTNLILSNLDIEFCICKATEGNYFVDKFCDAFIQNCKSKGILYGFYHFAGTGNPEEEAKFFYDNCTGYIGEGIPVLDYEVWGQNADDVSWCEGFITEFHALSGVWPMLYISASHCMDFNRSGWIPQTCGLWVAGYPADYTSWTNDDIPYSIEPWEFAAIWQFTSSLMLPGYAHALDGDIAYMDSKAWAKYAASSSKHSANPVDKPSPEPEKKVISGRFTFEVDD